MSKAQLVITALFVDHQAPAEVATRYRVHRARVYKLKARYEAEGEAAFEPRSRRPKNSPNATPTALVDRVLLLCKQLAEAGLDAGAETIGLHCRPCSTRSSRPTTTTGRTAPCRAGPPPRRSTTRSPRPYPAALVTPTPTTGSVTTGSARPATSPCGWPADSATSAWAEPTPEPTSSCSSRTSTSASSTRSPANSSGSSPSIPTATTSPPEHPKDPPANHQNDNSRTHNRGSSCRR
jgi:Helix-turn-helix domain